MVIRFLWMIIGVDSASSEDKVLSIAVNGAYSEEKVLSTGVNSAFPKEKALSTIVSGACRAFFIPASTEGSFLSVFSRSLQKPMNRSRLGACSCNSPPVAQR